MPELVGKLKAFNLLTEREEQRLMPQQDPHSQQNQVVDIDYLIEVLDRKSKNAYELFYKALKAEGTHLGHRELVGLIEPCL